MWLEIQEQPITGQTDELHAQMKKYKISRNYLFVPFFGMAARLNSGDKWRTWYRGPIWDTAARTHNRQE